MSDWPRAITADEAAVVSWLLTHASVVGPLAHLLSAVSALRVVDGCRCGCASVSFVAKSRASPYRLIGDAIGCTSNGARVDVLLWGGTGAVAGIEIVGYAPRVSGLPTLDSLQPQKPAA